MRRKAVAFGCCVASLAGLYTLWTTGQTEPSTQIIASSLQQVLDYLILPGIIAGVLVNASVHVASRWTMVAVNFILYFGLAYGAERLWMRRKARSAERQPGA